MLLKENNSLNIVVCAKVDRTMTSGYTVFQEIRPGAGFKTGDVEEKIVCGGLPKNDVALGIQRTPWYSQEEGIHPDRFEVTREGSCSENYFAKPCALPLYHSTHTK